MKQSRNDASSLNYRLKKYNSIRKRITILIFKDNDILYFAVWYLI